MSGKQLRDDGINQVLENDKTWARFALDNFRLWCRYKKAQGVDEITLEDFKKDLIEHYPDMKPHHHNCWGAITRTASLQGMLIPTDRSVRMTLSAAHARYAKVWRIA